MNDLIQKDLMGKDKYKLKWITEHYRFNPTKFIKGHYRKIKIKEKKILRYFSMFSGIGGFELGIKRAYDNKQSAKKQQNRKRGNRNTNERSVLLRTTEEPPLCVGYSEIDRYAIQIYEKHFWRHKNYGNAKKINTNELPDFDLLVGGFPCQAFSIAGRRKGFEDTRGTLFFEIARVLKAKQPRMFLLENVKGLLNHDKGKTFTKILKTIDELGYNAEWQVLNSKHFGVPQNRERVFIIGHLRETSSRQIFPLGESNKSFNEENSEICKCHKAGYYKGSSGTHIGTLRTHKDGQGFRSMKENICPAIPARAREDGSGQPVIRAVLTPIRRLTPIECERLQGFPDNWTAEGAERAGHPIDISDSQRYKCLGNAVTVNVIEEIIKRMF